MARIDATGLELTETVVKVNKKVFLFAGSDDGDGAGITVKLPESRDQALGLPDATPAGYGLGKAGWVSITFTAQPPPLGVLLDWLEESYRTVAPKRLVRELDGKTHDALPPACRDAREYARYLRFPAGRGQVASE